MALKPWRVSAVHQDGVTFSSSEGFFHANCIEGRFNLEALYAFSVAECKPLKTGMAYHLYEQKNPDTGEMRRFRIEHPEKLRLGPCVTKRGYNGFRLHTPTGRKVDLWFTQKIAPISLKQEIERLFAEPLPAGQEEHEDGRQGQFAQEPVPADGEARQEPGLPEGDQGQQEHQRFRKESIGSVEDARRALEVFKVKVPVELTEKYRRKPQSTNTHRSPTP